MGFTSDLRFCTFALGIANIINMSLNKPSVDEYHNFYHGYVSKIDTENIIDYLRDQGQYFLELLETIDESRADFQYAPGKWTIKQMLNHMNDTERIFTYRALALSRGESNAIPGYDHNAYVEAVDVSNRSIFDLAEEFATIRVGTVSFYRNLQPSYGLRMANVNGNPMSVRALAFITAGHLQHHKDILVERYLGEKS